MFLVLAGVIGFFLGSIPWALVIGKSVHGLDIRTQGSGNLGAANAFRILGPPTGILVLILDGGKGWAAIRLGETIAGEGSVVALTAGLAAILGHVLSPWVGFRGGKGVATAGGVFLTLAPWATLLTLAVWLIVMFLTRFASAAAIGAAVVLPISIWWLVKEPGPVLWVAVVVAVLVVWRHKSNVGRILRGEETRFELRPPRTSQTRGG